MTRSMLLHNPRCSKSRTALKLLEENGAEFDVREYLKEPLSMDELRILHKRIGRPPAEWLRWGQREAKDLGLSKDDPPMKLLEAMAEHPILIERPILIHGDEATVGRPDPEEAFQGVL